MAFNNVTLDEINVTINGTDSTITAFNATINNSYSNSATIFLQVLPKETGWLIAAGVAVFFLAVFFLVWFLVRQN